MAAGGEGGKTLCGGLDTVPAEAQTAIDNMNPRRLQDLFTLHPQSAIVKEQKFAREVCHVYPYSS
ncbi:MAG: hypothetical protein LBB83_10965 [Treponema sp.]|jgi:hypothetical protein|nr:hypothetical protein [Treponema sp.]